MANELQNPQHPEDPEFQLNPEDMRAMMALLQEEAQQKREEIELRKMEIELSRDGMSRDHSFAEKSIEIQQADRREQRQHRENMASKFITLVCGGLALLFLFLSYALYLGNEDLVKTLIIQLATAAISIFGGYSAGKAKGKKEASESDTKDSE